MLIHEVTKEARFCARVTGWTVWPDQHQQRVSVAVKHDLFHRLGVARSLALVPERVARTGPEPRFAAFAGAIQTLLIHVREHQDPPGACILHDCRHQAILVESDLGYVHRIVTPRARR